MTNKEKQNLHKRWWVFCDNIEDKIEDTMSIGDGVLFLLLLPVWFILKTMQWLMYLVGSWIIKSLPTTD